MPYVKLYKKDGQETVLPSTLSLTEESKKILEKGKDGQGFIYFIDIDSGKIHVLAANNPSKQSSAAPTQDDAKNTMETDQAKKQSLENEKKKILLRQQTRSITLSEKQEALASTHENPESPNDFQDKLEKEIQILQQELVDLDTQYQAIQESLKTITPKKISSAMSKININIPIDRNGNHYGPNEFATTTREKTSQTGSTGGGGDLHVNGEHVLGFGSDKNVLAGGFWIKRENNSDKFVFQDFRTRSTANTKLIKFNPLYRIYFEKSLKKGHEVGHTQIYAREIPKIYLDNVLDVFLKTSTEIYVSRNPKANQKELKNLANDIQTSFSFRTDSEDSVIPKSTREHLSIENEWLKNQEKIIKELFNRFDLSKINTEESGALTMEAGELIESFFNKDFPENRILFQYLYDYVRENKYTAPLVQSIRIYLNELFIKEAKDNHHEYINYQLFNYDASYESKYVSMDVQFLLFSKFYGFENAIPLIKVLYHLSQNGYSKFSPDIIELFIKQDLPLKAIHSFVSVLESFNLLAQNNSIENYAQYSQKLSEFMENTKYITMNNKFKNIVSELTSFKNYIFSKLLEDFSSKKDIKSLIELRALDNTQSKLIDDIKKNNNEEMTLAEFKAFKDSEPTLFKKLILDTNNSETPLLCSVAKTRSQELYQFFLDNGAAEQGSLGGKLDANRTYPAGYATMLQISNTRAILSDPEKFKQSIISKVDLTDKIQKLIKQIRDTNDSIRNSKNPLKFFSNNTIDKNEVLINIALKTLALLKEFPYPENKTAIKFTQDEILLLSSIKTSSTSVFEKQLTQLFNGCIDYHLISPTSGIDYRIKLQSDGKKILVERNIANNSLEDNKPIPFDEKNDLFSFTTNFDFRYSIASEKDKVIQAENYYRDKLKDIEPQAPLRIHTTKK